MNVYGMGGGRERGAGSSSCRRVVRRHLGVGVRHLHLGLRGEGRGRGPAPTPEGVRGAVTGLAHVVVYPPLCRRHPRSACLDMGYEPWSHSYEIFQWAAGRAHPL